MADYDPKVEHNPNRILVGTIVLVLAAFGVVTMIIMRSEAQSNAPAVAAEPAP